MIRENEFFMFVNRDPLFFRFVNRAREPPARPSSEKNQNDLEKCPMILWIGCIINNFLTGEPAVGLLLMMHCPRQHQLYLARRKEKKNKKQDQD